MQVCLQGNDIFFQDVYVGADEHGWSTNGIFNFEDGCYAKVIRLSKEAEPEIYITTRKFGTILENVQIDSYSRKPDLDDDTFTENMRAPKCCTGREAGKC